MQVQRRGRAPGPLVGLAALLFAGTAAGLAARPATAAFPGENGKIAFTSERDGNREIYLIDPDGSGEVNITNHAGFDHFASWSLDAPSWPSPATGRSPATRTSTSWTPTAQAWSG